MDVTDDHYDSVAAENEEGKFDVEDKEEKKNDDDDSPTVEETYEVTTTKRKTIRTNYKIQEVSADTYTRRVPLLFLQLYFSVKSIERDDTERTNACSFLFVCYYYTQLHRNEYIRTYVFYVI